MAEGNVGSLWMSLGLRDEVSKELKKIAQGMDGVDSATKKAQEKLNNLRLDDAIGKNKTYFDKISKALGDATQEARELQAVIQAIKDFKGGTSLFRDSLGTHDLSKYYSVIQSMSAALDKLSMKSPLSDMGEKLQTNMLGMLKVIEGLDKLKGEKEFFFDNVFKTDSAKAGLASLQEQVNSLITEANKLYHSKGVGIKGVEWFDGLDKRINSLYNEYGKLNEAEEKELATGKKVVENTEKTSAVQQQEEAQTRKTAEAVEQQAQAERKAAEAIEQKVAAQQKANGTAIKGQPAVVNKDFEQAVDRMVNGTKELTEEQKKAQKAFEDTKAKAEETGKSVSKMLDSLLGGKGSTGMSMHEIAKKAADYSKELAELDTRRKKAAHDGKEGGMKGDPTKDMREQIKNAQTFLDLMQRIDLKQKEIAQKKAEQPNVNTRELERANTLLERFGATLMDIMRKGNVDGSAVMGNFPKALQATMREVGDVMSQFAKDNPMSVFAGGADKASAAISNIETKIKDLQRLMAEGQEKGYKTGMLPENIRYMQLRLTELNRLFGDNWQKMTDKPYMNNLFSDIAKTMTLARNAEHEYGKEKARTIAVTKAQEEAQKKTDDAASAEYDRKRRQAEAAKKAQDEELKAMSDYAKRYMELQEAKRKADEKAAAERKRISDAEQKRIDTDAQRMSRLYAQMGIGIGKAERVGMGGLGLGVNTAALDKALGEASELRKKIEEANVALMGKGGRAAYEWYSAQAERLKANLDNAAQAQKELNTAQEKANRKADAQAARDAAKAKREDAAAERQRQSELKITEARMNSLTEALHRMQEARLGAVGRGADTTVIDQEIAKAKHAVDFLNTAKAELQGNGWRLSLGTIGNVGDGRMTSQLKQTAADQARVNTEIDATNKKKQQEIELERKHQAEIAKTAAKVRSDLVKAFEQAKDKAGGMSQTMQDLKSLFMQGGIVYGAQQFVMSVIQTGGELEKQHIALQSILGDMQNANTMFAQVKELALNSPFTFSELNADVKQLAAYGVEYDDLYDTTKRLADMSSGLGVSFERIALAFGQVQARGWLDGKELRQIAYAGIPLLEKLSEYYSKLEGRKVSTSEVKTRISGRGVDFEDVKNIFWEMTDAGGQFYNMQQVLSETLLGRYNKLKDAWEIMLSEFASGNNIVGSGLKGIIDLVTSLVQALHTAAPVVAAAFSGFALRKLQTTLGGGVGTALLQGKASMAAEIQQRVLLGEKVSEQELRILATKKQITIEDLQALAAAKALGKAELDRMLVTKSITPEMYRQMTAQMGLATNAKSLSAHWAAMKVAIGGLPGKIKTAAVQTASWFANIRTNMAMTRSGITGVFKDFALKGRAAISIVGTGIKGLGATLWTAIGGLPGLLMTGGTMAIGYIYTKNEELKQAMAQTADELKDRAKQINDFFKENDASKAIASGNIKAIDNMIDEYKEKLKQLAPYKYDNLVMRAEEKQSHEERLKYLAEELRLIQEANKTAQMKLADSGMYKDLKDAAERVSTAFAGIDQSTAELIIGGVDKGTARKQAFGLSLDVRKATEDLKDEIEEVFGNIGKDTAAREAAMQSMSNLFAGMGIPEDRANEIRASVLQAFGVTDGWLEHQVGSEMRQMIDSVAPDIAMKIRSGQKLNDAETAKVKELMDDAKKNLALKYPEFEATLQRLLAASRFTAVIDLVVNDAGEYNDIQKELLGRVPDVSSEKVRNYAISWGKADGWKEAREAANNEAKARKEEWEAAKKSGAKDTGRKYEAYQLARNAASMMHLLDPEKGSGGKAGGRGGKGREEDKELKDLQQRLGDLKEARQMYQKYTGIGMGKAQARNKTMAMFPNLDKGKVNLDDYLRSVERLKEGFNFGKSTERKKAETQLNREMAEWDFSETLKPEWERVAANFKEALEKGVRQADLEKELYEKTGNVDFAKLAWTDGTVWDGQTRKMADEYKAMTGMDVDLGMTDADAKKLLENNQNAYVLWQKITALVKDKYVKSLQSAASIMAETATTQEKLAAIDAKYAERIEIAESAGRTGEAERYRQTRDKEKGQVQMDAFKGSADYLLFFEAINELGNTKAQEVATKIREQLNRALADGSLDAREYAKQIAQVEEQLNKLGKASKTLWTDGFIGKGEQKYSDGTEKFNKGTTIVSEGEKKIREGKIAGDANMVSAGKMQVAAGKTMQKAGETMMGAGLKIKEGWQGAVNTMNKVDANIQGIVNAFNDVKDTMGALGFDTESDGWQDATAVMNSLSGMSTGVKNAISGFATGDIGGGIAGAISVVTSPIKAFAAAHDAKMDRQIKLAERSITELERTRDYVKSILDKTLGGVYEWKMDAETRKTLEKVTKGKEYSDATKAAASEALSDPTNAYNAERATLLAQRDEMQRQRDAESNKKKKDKDKIADYDEELKQMDLTIKQLSTDFLKDIYGVDMKSWASQLTDAVVSAWEKGEDAIDAYRKKAKEMVKDLTKNILSQKIMEKAMEGPLGYLTDIIEQKGKLEDSDMPKLIDDLTQAGEDATYNITKVLDGLKAQGYDFSESGSGSVSNSIKNITEETAGILASYLNAIRLDVSVNRANLKTVCDLLKDRVPEMGQIQKAQLGQLTQLVVLAEARNEKLDRMMDWMTAVTTSGRKKIYIS